MKKHTYKYLLIILTVLFCSQFLSCGDKAPTESDESQNRIKSWSDDLDYFSSQIKQKQYGFSSQIDPQYFDNKIQSIKNSISSLQDYEIYFKMQELVAAFNVGHFSTSPSYSQKFHFLPFLTKVFPDGVFITMTDQSNTSLMGKKIISIGGKSISEVEDSLKKLISHENIYWFYHLFPQTLCCVEILKFYGFTSDQSSIELEVEGLGKLTINSTEKRITEAASGMTDILSGKSLPFYLQNQSKYYWYTIIQSSNVLYIKYNKCANASDQSFSSFTNDIKDFLSSNHMNKIIVDLRNNGGGSSSIINPLLNYLESSVYNQTGTLFTAINWGTFSSALLNSISFKQSTNSILVGEPTGEKPNSYGQVYNFSLPNSGINVSYCSKYFKTMDGDPEALFPDVDVEINSQDYFNCKDPVLDHILSYK